MIDSFSLLIDRAAYLAFEGGGRVAVVCVCDIEFIQNANVDVRNAPTNPRSLKHE